MGAGVPAASREIAGGHSTGAAVLTSSGGCGGIKQTMRLQPCNVAHRLFARVASAAINAAASAPHHPAVSASTLLTFVADSGDATATPWHHARNAGRITFVGKCKLAANQHSSSSCLCSGDGRPCGFAAGEWRAMVHTEPRKCEVFFAACCPQRGRTQGGYQGSCMPGTAGLLREGNHICASRGLSYFASGRA